jgi:O-antigen/teichoic acid export membrane protein
MNESHNKKSFKIYIWKGASLVLRFLTLFSVTPFLAREPEIYGIYAVCTSITLFLNYADFGFLRSSQKFASESYARNDIDEEIRFVGFGIFILTIFTLILTLLFFYLSQNPHLLFNDLESKNQNTASQLLIIMAAFTPFTIINRFVILVFSIRLADYIYQRLIIIANLIILTSVFYFFRDGNYQIVNYLFFLKLINVFAILTGLILVHKRYNYKIAYFIKQIRFKRNIYDRTSGLAFSGLFLIMAYVIYYELDHIAVSKIFGVESVAIYSVALAIPLVFRSLFGIYFSPLAVRANYYAGLGDEEGLRRFTRKVISFSTPIVVIPTVALSLVAKPLILSWVGYHYEESINMFRILALLSTLSFISYPISAYIIATEKLRELYIVGSIQPILYWGGILSTFPSIGLWSFPIFKLLSAYLSEMYYFSIGIRHLAITVKGFIRGTIIPLIGPLVFLVLTLHSISTYLLPTEKAMSNVFIILSITGLFIALSFVILYFTSNITKTEFNKVARSILYKRTTNSQ